MKHNLLKSVILSVILLMGVSNAWGKTSFYLNATSAWDKDGAKFSINYTVDGIDRKFSGFMSKISGDFYTVTVDEDNIKTIIAVRHNSSATTPTWGNKWNQTSNIDISTSKHNLIKITAQGNGDATYTIESHGFTTEGQTTIYFDNTLMKWDQVFLRVGTGAMNADAKGYNQAYKLKKVEGTNLYTGTFPIWRGYTTFNFANNCGWTNDYNIYQPYSIYGDEYQITAQTYYAAYDGAINNHIYIPSLEGVYDEPTHCTDYPFSNRNVYCTVKLHPVSDSRGKDYGQFTIKYNETTYESDADKDVTINNIFYGSTITIVESHHNYPKIFNGDLALKKGGGGWSIIENPINYSITVDNDIEIKERFVVRKEAVINKNLHLFLKIPKNLDKNNGSDIGWHNNDGTDGSSTNGYSTAKEDCANFVWLGEGKYEKEILGSVYDPNNNIDERGCGSAGQKEGSYLMRPLSIEDNDHNYYYCTVTDSCWLNVKFERKHADSDPGNSPLMDAGVHRFPGDERVCFRIKEKDGGGFTGVWELAPKYTVQLGYCEFGEYSVMCNGNIYTSTPNQNVSFEAPYGSEITFVEGTPLQDIYKGGWMLREPNKTRLDATQPYIVKGNITLDDNFVTRNERVFYFAVPETLKVWNQTIDSKKAEYYIWTRDDVDSFDMLGDKCHGHPMQSYGTKNGYKYYKFTLSAERNAFRFEHKVPWSEDTTKNNSNPTLARTHYLQFQVPTTEKNCYYLTGEYTKINGYDYYNGYWDILPVNDDQYRLLYVEQVVEKDKENNTVLTRKKAHPSDIFTIGDITAEGKKLSLHVYRDRPYTGISWYDEEGKNHKYYTTKASNAGVILQKTVGGKWVDISNNMVFGPLEAVPEVALLPGRKNAASNNSTDYDYLYYDDGIENIKKDEHEDEGNGVWNFVVKKDNRNNVYIALNETHRYKGEYYIRTVAAEGGWENYKTINQMTRSDISKVHSNYSHYFCKWIGQAGTDVQFTVANDYGCAISDTLMTDRTDLKGRRTSETEKIVRGLILPKEANVRFSWNEKTNFIHRAYLGGSTHVHERFLVLIGSGDNNLFDLNGNQLPEGKNTPANPDPRYGLNTNEEIFTDISNWVYYADVKMIPRAQVKLTADYKWKEGGKDIEVIQYFVGTPTEFCDTTLNTADGAPECKQQYRMRLLYDFKTNELISAYVPGGQAGKEIEAIETNLMLIREENNPASQMTFKTNNMQDVGKRAYGVLELTQNTLEDDEKNVYVRSLYWISFPFDVRISDVFGFGNYGEHWIIQSYDGAKRAREGLWADSESSWVYHFDSLSLNADNEDPTDDGILKKGVGYVVALNLGAIKDSKLFKGRITTLALYFPATTTIQKHIDKEATESIEVPEHACSINRPTPKGDRRIKDSHWNVIGVPSYVNSTGTFEDNSPTEVELQFYYRWLGYYDKYEAVSAKNYGFNSMNAYMVQYAGTLNWSNVVKERIAAKRNTEAIQEHHLRLELQQNGLEQDRTFINLQEDEVTTGFDFNYDLCKINNKGANIYSLIATDTYPVEAAGNVIPVEEAVIPLGIKLDAAGEYTFAMPDGTDGIVVELIDYETNTRTNMLLDNYTVKLDKGTFENRFALHVKPSKVTTSVGEINTNTTGVKKYLIDGILYMQKDGVLYDAQGRCVQ